MQFVASCKVSVQLLQQLAKPPLALMELPFTPFKAASWVKK